MKNRKRRGLAPLEFVMWLPVLMFVTALIVNFGTMAAWRMRGEVVARDAAWRVRYPRTGAAENRPTNRYWPEEAAMQVEADEQLPLDILADHRVIYGPLENGVTSQQPLLQATGSFRGQSEITRTFPLLPRLGEYESGRIRHFLMDRLFQIATMNSPNFWRRTLLIYNLPATAQHLPTAFQNAVELTISGPSYAGFEVMDNDADFIRYRGSPAFFWLPISHPYRNYPRPNLRFSENDYEIVYHGDIVPMVDAWVRVRQSDGTTGLRFDFGRISDRPTEMTASFLSLYRQELEQLEAEKRALQEETASLKRELERMPQTRSNWERQIDTLQSRIEGAGPGDAARFQTQIDDLQANIDNIPNRTQEINDRFPQIDARIAEIDPEIAILKEKISQLEAYEDRLPAIRRQMQDAALADDERGEIELQIRNP